MTYVQAILLAIVEGLTEFLPISSTGHMIITSSLMGIATDNFTKLFEVSIQLGAILAVVVFYIKRFFKSFDFYIKLFCAFLPTAILGLLLKKKIDMLIENVTVVACTLLVGGVFLLFVDKLFAKNEEQAEQDVTYKKGFVIGFFQAISMIPGVSRSAASIVGGLTQGLNRKAAAEFSFFLAVPTMFAATAKSLYDDKDLLLSSTDYIPLLILGNVIAFIVGLLAIKAFVGYLTKHGFKIFGYYRIVVGLILLVLIGLGVDLKII